jgi:hypothetical protein
MPTTVVEVVEGFAFCPDPRCPGYEQVATAVRVNRTSWSYIELGGDLPGTERSMEYESFPLEDGEQPPNCPRCGARMEATTQQRPEYARISGQDPLRLLSLDQNTISRAMQGTQSDQAVELANMRAEMAEMRAEMMRMMLEARGGAMPPTEAEIIDPPAGAAGPPGARGHHDESSEPPPKRGPGRPRKDA